MIKETRTKGRGIWSKIATLPTHILQEVTMKRVVYKLTVVSPALSHMFTDWEEDRRRILRWRSVFLQNQFSSSHLLMNFQIGKLMFCVSLQVHCYLSCLSHMFTDWRCIKNFDPVILLISWEQNSFSEYFRALYESWIKIKMIQLLWTAVALDCYHFSHTGLWICNE